MQWTTGRLNYINGYTTKAHDSLDFHCSAEQMSKGKHDNWLTIYRQLCKSTVCIPEVALSFCQSEPMIRSCRKDAVYAPIAFQDSRKANASERLYDECYLQPKSMQQLSFLEYNRLYHFNHRTKRIDSRHPRGKETIAIGIRYAHELKDQFVGQVAVMLMPHTARIQLQQPRIASSSSRTCTASCPSAPTRSRRFPLPAMVDSR